MIEPNAIKYSDLNELFDCVAINKLSEDNFPRIGRLCREFCKETQTNTILKLILFRSLARNLWEDCRSWTTSLTDYNSYNNIRPIPVTLCKWIPHVRTDVIFPFARRFHNVEAKNSYGLMFDDQEVPYSSDWLCMEKWSENKYFRWHDEEVRDKYVAEESATEDQTAFGKQTFMDFGNSKEDLSGWFIANLQYLIIPKV